MPSMLPDNTEAAAPAGILVAGARQPAQAEQPASDAISPYVWYVIGLITVINVLNYMDRIAMSVLMPYIKADLGLSDGQLGLLIGFAFFLIYASCGIPIARWADRGHRRTVITVSLILWSSMTALSGAAQNFWQLMLARAGLGIGEAGCAPASSTIITDLVPFKRRAGIFAVIGLGAIIGSSLGIFLAGVLGERLGWRWTFVVMGLPGILLAIVVRATLREPAQEQQTLSTAADTPTGLAETLAMLWSCITYRRVVQFLVINAFIMAAFQQWYASFYARTFGLSLSEIGISLGLSTGLGSAFGLLLGGLIANRTVVRNEGMPIVIGTAALTLSCPAALGVLFAPSSTLSMTMILVTGALWNIPTGYVVSTLYSITPSSIRATGGAISVFAIAILGFGLGPFAVGLASDALAPVYGARSLQYALLVPIFAYPAYVWSLYAIRRNLAADLALVSEPGT